MVITRGLSFAAWWFAVAAVVGACGEARPPLCTPGASVACVCTNGRSGAQSCGATGTFGPCQCSGEPGDAAAGDDRAPPGDVSVPHDATLDGPPTTDVAPAMDAAVPSDMPALVDVPATDGPSGGGVVCLPGACNIAELSLAERWSCARLTNGQLWCWGARPLVLGARRPVRIADVDDATQIEIGLDSACFRRSSMAGRVFCWGRNTSGELGTGSRMNLLTPERVVDLMDATHFVIGSHYCALRATGNVACWGGVGAILQHAASFGTVLRPTDIPGVRDAVSILGAAGSTCVRSRDGAVACWGPRDAAPVPLVGFEGAIQLARGRNDLLCGRFADGTIRCRGSNTYGQLGLGTIDRDLHPMVTTVPGITQAVELDAAGALVCARLADGRVLCWGENTVGQVGDGTRTTRPSPTPVTGLVDAVDLEVSPEHACVLRRLGRLVCWGANGSGQVSDTAADTVLTPTEVVGLPPP